MKRIVVCAATRRKVSLAIFALCIMLFLCLLGIMICGAGTSVMNTRTESSGFYTQRPAARQLTVPGTPQGVVLECKIPVDDMVAPDAYLMFYTYHQYVDVYIGGELVFSMHPSEKVTFTKTVGSSWVKIPLYDTDKGEVIKVRLTPVYDFVREEIPEFLIGSELDIFMHQYRDDQLQLMISMLLILFGGAVIIPAGILREEGAFMLCLSAIMIGAWRLLDSLSITLLLESNPLLIYYTSLVPLMGVGIPIVYAVKNRKDEKNSRLFEVYAMVSGVILALQLLVQLLGWLDLRQTLLVTHTMQAIGGALILGNLVYEGRKEHNRDWLRNRKLTFCVLAVAAFLDLGLFYVTGRSDHLVVTTLAYLVIVAVYSIRLLIRYLDQQRQWKDREDQLLQSRSTVALGQIRSHFIFNLLNAISGMCKYDPAKADETIVRFARYLRAHIDILQNDGPVPFGQVLDNLEDYVLLEQVRFGDRIRFETDIEEEDFRLPPLVLQPIVENAIKHGLNVKEDGGTIRLSTRSDAKGAYITVEDDGVGFEPHQLNKEGSVGLRNVRFRLKHMVNGEMTINSTPGLGTCVRIMIPREEG